MTTTFPLSTPSALDIDAGGVLAFLDALDAAEGVETHGLILLRHGRVAAQGWWDPYSPDRVHLLYSLSKSFTAAAVALAVDEGLIDLDSSVLSYFPELDADITDERSRRILVRHVLAMASGHREETLERARALDPENLVRGFLLLPPDEEPGTVFAYNQPCTYSLGAIVRRVSGGSLLDYLRPRLLDPLGIDQAAWVRDETGAELGFSGLHATTESIAKLGQLYLQRGEWEGTRLLPEAWVAAATQAQVANPDEGNPDWRQGYGFQFWMARHGFRGDGAYGQYCVVLPEYDVVLAMTGQSLDMQAVLDAAWEHLLPAFGGAGDGRTAAGIDDETPGAGADPDTTARLDADDRLAKRLAAAALPPVRGLPLDGTATTQSFTPSATSEPTLPTLSEVTLTQAAPGESWRVALVDGESRLEGAVGEGTWALTGPLAISGAATGGAGADSLAIDIVFVETPHRLHLALDPEAATFTARWETEPLRARLIDLRKPAA